MCDMSDPFAPEHAPNPEATIAQAVGYVDSFHNRLGDIRAPGNRKERCGDIARQVQMSAAKEGLSLPMIEIPKLHGLFGGDPRKAFMHYANLGDDLGVLVDLTFCQFVDESGRISQVENSFSGLVSDSRVAEMLLRDGMIPLTDETLRGYLSVTTVGDKSYIASATVEALRGQRLL